MYSWEYVMGYELAPIIRVRESNFKRVPFSDYIPEPKGWHNCPCESPKCSNYDKCGSDDTMCHAFEEWTTRGGYTAIPKRNLMDMRSTMYAPRTRGVVTPRESNRNETMVRKLERLWLDNKKTGEIAKELGIKPNYVGRLVGLHRRDKRYCFPRRRQE